MAYENLPTERERVSIHEAGHGVVAHRLGLPLRSITVGCRSGETELDGNWAPRAADRASYEVAVFAAGRVAVILAGFESEAGEWDEREIKARAEREPACEARGRALSELALRAHWGAVRKLAAMAIFGYLTREQARDFIELAPVAPLVCDLARLRALARVAGHCAALTTSKAFERLIELAATAPARAEREALVAAHEQERLARLRALPPSPAERAAARARAAVNVRSDDPRAAAVLEELKERMARMRDADASKASRPAPISPHRPPPARRPVTRTRPGWIGA